MNVVTRIAPSPTGEMHIGTVRTALFNYLFAKHHGGKYIVRIEDTDKERNRPEWVEAIWRDFEWCGLLPDERYVQSENLNRHKELLTKLVADGKAYLSKEPAKDDPTRTVEVVRLKNPNTRITFTDLVRGEVSFDTEELKDFVIARAIDDPLYHFAVVVDDHDEGVTHVLRAEEHLSNTPRQILILEALGFERPTYGHFPLILAADRSKLSKRKHSASVEHYRAEGYLPEAMVNYLALLGWNPGTDQELFTLEALIASFDMEKVHKAGAVFDPEKMKWFNREYLLRMPDAAFEREAIEFLRAGLAERNITVHEEIARRIMPVIKERIALWSDLVRSVGEGEYDFFFADPAIIAEKLPDKRSDAAAAYTYLSHVREELEKLEIVTEETVQKALWDYAPEHGRAAVLWPLRYALTGREKSPSPFVVAGVIGKTVTLRRVEAAMTALTKAS